MRRGWASSLASLLAGVGRAYAYVTGTTPLPSGRDASWDDGVSVADCRPMSRWHLLLPLFGLVPAALVSCTGGKSSSAPPVVGDDGGGDDGGGGSSLTYAPAGCKYSVLAPRARSATRTSPSTTTGRSIPSTGVPVRVRVGLGGGTTMGQSGYADRRQRGVHVGDGGAEQRREGADGHERGRAEPGVDRLRVDARSHVLGTANTYFHEVHVCGLTPDTTYYYQVGGGPAGAEVWSATQSFTTMPATVPSSGITVGVFGDARDTVGDLAGGARAHEGGRRA